MNRKCRICGCTETAPCMGGCSWVREGFEYADGFLCDVCAHAITAAIEIAEEAGPGPRLNPTKTLRNLVAELERLIDAEPWSNNDRYDRMIVIP